MTPARLFARLRGRLLDRPDTEHEQAFMRIFNAIAFGLYLLPGILAPDAGTDVHLRIWAGYVCLALVILSAVFLQPGVSHVRRTAGAIGDVGILTWVMLSFGELAAPLFLVYLWITFANAFRFGAVYLTLSLALSLAGFGIVLVYEDFWQLHQGLGYGVMIGLVVLSLYIRKLVNQLFDALARAQAANQAKRRFISVVSHEMRTPLNAIIGMSDLLRDTPLNREQADMLQTLRSSSRMMLTLVEDVLDFSKIEAGKLAIDKLEFDLHALVNSTCRIVGAQAAAKGVDFVVSIMPDVPPALRGDPYHLRQVLVNLVGNAVKFTQKGSVTVHVMVASDAASQVRLKFSVRDTGIGMSPDAQGRIFDSFTQADESTTRRFGGTGLGTTIAKQLVELMGGSIGVESAVGLGSTFWFELELEKQDEKAVPGSAGELAGVRVLMIGFPSTEREPLEAALRSWGAVAVPVISVEEGAARLVAEISLAKPYHSALVYSPEANLELARRFTRAAPNPVPPVVLAVPREAAAARFEALAAGYAAVLELPVEKRRFYNVLHSVAARDEVREGVLRLEDYARRGGKRLRVLVADDNPTNREVLSKIVDRGGHAVTVVEDGEQALDAIERERFDVVVLDRNMPRLGGLDALKALRLMTRTQERLPAIILSADVTAEARREAFEAGADAVLSKPIEAVRLLEEIQAAARGARQDAEQAKSFGRRREDRRGETPLINLDTLRHLEELGSSRAFLKRLVEVFVADNEKLRARLDVAMGARNFAEFRTHLHALKGSSASIGTDRLTRLCATLGAYSDAELRLQGAKLVQAIAEELAAARQALERHVREREQTAV